MLLLLIILIKQKPYNTKIFGQAKEENNLTWNQQCASTLLPLLIYD